MKKQIFLMSLCMWISFFGLPSLNSQVITVIDENILEGSVDISFIGNDIYISEYAGNKISKIDITQSNPTPINIVSNIDTPNGSIYYDDFLYFAEQEMGRISKIDLSNSNPTLIEVLSGLISSTKLLLEESNLYFTDQGAGKVFKIDLATPSPAAEEIISGLIFPIGLAINQNDLYISMFNDGIKKINLTDPSASLITVIDQSVGVISDMVIRDNDLFVGAFFNGKVLHLDISQSN